MHVFYLSLVTLNYHLFILCNTILDASNVILLNDIDSWVQSQLRDHPDEVWEDGVRDYLAQASDILVRVVRHCSFPFLFFKST